MKTHTPHHTSLTPNQSLVLETLKAAQQPLGAYALLDALREHGFKAPLQIYRILNTLAEKGFVHRLERLNAWTVCCDSTHDTAPVFAICNACGLVTEHLNERLCDDLAALSERTGFVPDQSVIEIYGQCSSCVVKA